MSTAAELGALAFDRYNAGDIDGFCDIYSTDAVMQQPEGRFEGKDAIGALWREGFARYAEARVELLEVVDRGDTAAVEYVFRATMQDGKTVSLPVLELLRTDGTRITEHRMYFDQATVAGQLGLLSS